MRVLVAWADGRSPNLGVRALAAGSEAIVQSLGPGVETTFVNFGSGTAPSPIGTWRDITKERVLARRGLGDWLAGFDLFLDTRSGDSFADIYGLRRLAAMTALGDLAAARGVPVVLGPQTVGPFGSRRGRLLARRTLARAAAVLARDSASVEAARALGRRDVVATTDVVFALPPALPDQQRDVVLNVSGLLWEPNTHVDHLRYRAVVVGLGKRLLAQGRRVTLLAHVLGSSGPDTDEPAVGAVAHVLGDVDAVVPEGLDEVRDVLASARVVIGSRMHACLNALSVGTPALPLAYSRKFAPLLADLGWTHVVDLRADVPHVDAVVAAIDDPRLDADVARVLSTTETRLGAARAALAGAVRMDP